ncbi:TonB-dependent receptor [Bombella apis]|uniref:TonB-dependent receptor n=1 Tax=Bombella apis TaxID=1785988 RepID=A0ABR9MNS1_9PROT|nr:TonB-dependent receptor [Bombella apis]MBE1723031.1 TonB-dependent receptor [Bombella apis]MBR9730838.1 TonB-dependent receptor [Bombella apis]
MVIPFRFSRRTVTLWCLLAGSMLTGHPVWAAGDEGREQTAKGQMARPGQPDGKADIRKKSVGKDRQQADAPPVETILVKARRREQMEVKLGGQAGVLGNKKGLDLPFNLRSYTSSMILNQQSQTLGQVLQNDPSVRTTYGFGNFSETFIIRGMPVYGDDVAINGLYGISPRQLISPQLYDSVQVLNGASAFINGAAPGGTSVGGNINLQFKHAGSEPLARLTGDYTSRGQGGGSLDVGRRFGRDDQFGIRFNAAGMDGQTSISGERRHSVALGLDTDWHNDDTRISLDINYQNQNVQQGRGSVVLNSGLTAVPRPTRPGRNWSQGWSYEDMHYVFGLLNVEHDLNSHVMLYGTFGGMTGHEEGNYDTVYVSDGLKGTGFGYGSYVPYQQTNESTRGGVRAHFRTGFLKHEVNAGGSALWSGASTGYAGGMVGDTSLYAPGVQAKPASVHHVSATPATKTQLYSLFFSDTMSFWHDRIALTGGFRYQHILQNSYQYTPTHYSRDAITPVVGLVVHVARHASLYFNRVEGLNQGLQAPARSSLYPNLVNAQQFLSPTRTVQYEVGGKYDIGRFSASLAFYRLDRPTGLVEDYGTEQIFKASGRQRNQGIELNVNGEIIHGLRFNGGSALIQAKQVKGDYVGNRAVGIPGYTINGNLEYDIPFMKGLTLTGRVTHTGHQWVNVQNSLRIPNWTTYDLGARYTFMMTPKRPMTFRFGVENLTNSHYWASSYTAFSSVNGYLTQGLPRTFKASFSTDM